MYLSHKKRVILPIICALMVALVVFIQISVSASASMNITVAQEGYVRIITGASDQTATRGYSVARQNFLEELAVERPTDTFSAVVRLDDYYSYDQVNTLIDANNFTAVRVYMWTPGETGKLSLEMTSNEIETDIERFLQKMSLREQSQAALSDLQKLENGDFRVYALTINTTAEALYELSLQEAMIAAVDVKYNPEAEAYASEENMNYSYVEAPAKPDGAL